MSRGSLILLLLLLLCFLHDNMWSLCLLTAKLAATCEPWRTATLGNCRQNKPCLHSLACCRAFYDINRRATSTVCIHMITSQEFFVIGSMFAALKVAWVPLFPLPWNLRHIQWHWCGGYLVTLISLVLWNFRLNNWQRWWSEVMEEHGKHKASLFSNFLFSSFIYRLDFHFLRNASRINIWHSTTFKPSFQRLEHRLEQKLI